MQNLESQWLILKIDEMAAKKRSACLLCWFATQGMTGRRITLQRCFCRSRYFTILLYYVRTWRISSFSGLYWKLMKWRQKHGWHAFYAIGMTGRWITLERSFWLSFYFRFLFYYVRTWYIPSFSSWIQKMDETVAKKHSTCLHDASLLQGRLEHRKLNRSLS